MLTFSQQAQAIVKQEIKKPNKPQGVKKAPKKDSVTEELQSLLINRKNQMAPSKSQLYFRQDQTQSNTSRAATKETVKETKKTPKPQEQLYARSLAQDSLDTVSESRKSQGDYGLKSRQMQDQQTKQRRQTSESRSGSKESRGHSQLRSVTSLEQIIRQNLRQKEKERALARKEEKSKQMKAKQRQLEYDAKLAQKRLKMAEKAQKLQLQALKDQLQSFKKKKSQHSLHQNVNQNITPAKPLTQSKISAKVSDSVSNGNSHKNLPLKMSAEQRRRERERQRFVSSTSSIEGVQWDPEAHTKSQRVLPIRQPSTQLSIHKPTQDDKSASKRDQRKAELGMEYLQLKKELALCLPLQSNQSAVNFQKQPQAIQKLGQQKEQRGKPSQDNRDIRKVDERSFSPVTNKLLKANLEQWFDEEIEKPKDPAVVKQLVVDQKRQWMEKEREKAQKQIHEQQRILKNLVSLNEYQCRLHKPAPSVKEKPLKKSVGRKKVKAQKGPGKASLKVLQKGGRSKNRQDSYEESGQVREIKQQSGAFEGQPVMNVQITSKRGDLWQNFKPLTQRSHQKSRSKSPRSYQPLSAATGSASQFHPRKQSKPKPLIQSDSNENVRTHTPVEKRDFISPTSAQLISAQFGQKGQRGQSRSDKRVPKSASRVETDQYRSATSKSHSSPPTLSLADGISGVSGQSVSKPVSQFGIHWGSNTPSHGARSDSQFSKRRNDSKQKKKGNHKRSNVKISPIQSQRSKQRRSPLSSKKNLPFQGHQPKEKPKQQNESKKDLNNDDLVVFLILTQAAKTIQRAWRKYKERKANTDSYHSPYLSQELAISNDTPAQTYSQQEPYSVQSHLSQKAANQRFLIKGKRGGPFQQKQQKHQKHQEGGKTHRRPTFSFGQDLQTQMYTAPQQPQRQPPVTLMGQETECVMEAGESISDLQEVRNPPTLMPLGKKEDKTTSAQIPLKNKQGNIPVDKLLKHSNKDKDDFIVSIAPSQPQAQKSSKGKKVFEYAGSLLRDAPQVFESQFSKGVQSSSAAHAETESKLVMNYGIDDDESRKGKFISRVAQQSDEDSLSSVAEKTDRIINYSAAMNTSEEAIEAAVNNSSTLKNPGDSQVNSSLLHKILPPHQSLQSNSQASSHEDQVDHKLDLRLEKGITFDPKDRFQMHMFRAVSGVSVDQRVSHAYSTSKQTVQVQSQISHNYMGSVISAGMLLPSLHSIEQSSSQLQSQSNQKSDQTNTPAIQFVAQLHNMSTSSDQQSHSNRSPSPIRYISTSQDNYTNFIDRQNISFQNALYQQNQYSFEGISHHSMPPIQDALNEATHSGNLLNHYGHVTSANNTNGSYFLHTNTSIFERNPFRDYTTTKLQEMLMNKHDLQEIIQIKEDALEYAKNLERGWITRQEKLAELSPRSLQRRRFELESWVTVSKSSKPSDKKSFSSSASLKVSSPRAVTIGTIEEERAQVAKIIEMVNKKTDEIKGKLRTKEPAPDRDAAPKPLIPPAPTINAANTILDASPVPFVREEVAKSDDELEISLIDEEVIGNQLKPKVDNLQLADAIVEQILQDLLTAELSPKALSQTLKRQPIPTDFRPEIMPQVEFQVNLDKSLSLEEQIIAGVDTSIEAVEQYIEGIFAQIRIRGKQFMGAFYTPIFKNPLLVLSNLQKQQIGQGNIDQLDLSNTLARENVIREALQQIKDLTKGETLAQEDNLSELLSESDHIHNKAIFDSVNEALNLYRPYGPAGEPMPWSAKPRQNFFLYAQEDMLNDVLGNVKMKLMEWATTRAGQLSSINVQVNQPKDEAIKTDGQAEVIKQQQVEVAEETLQIHRERCLAKLLAQDLMASEEKWIDYEHEETQAKLDLADIVLEQLVSEIVTELQTLHDL